MKLSRVLIGLGLFFFVFIGGNLLLKSLDNKKIFRQDIDAHQMVYCTIPHEGWSSLSPMKMEFFISQPASSYRLSLLFRYDNRLDSMAKKFEVTLQGSDGYLSSYSVNCHFSEKPGFWLGQGVALKQQSFVLLSSLSPSRMAFYNLSIRPLMSQQDQKLLGIENVGLLLERIKKN